MLPGLPTVMNGARVAVIADLQFGMWLGNERMVSRAVRDILDIRPAAVLTVFTLRAAPQRTPPSIPRRTR